jgi:hypothetical protein
MLLLMAAAHPAAALELNLSFSCVLISLQHAPAAGDQEP